MRTTILIITLFALQISFSFAGKTKSNDNISKEIITVVGGKTTSNQPQEVLFNEIKPTLQYLDLAPVTPAEADFPDEIDAFENYIGTLKPITPPEADFE
jgi:hypothetical protein